MSDNNPWVLSLDNAADAEASSGGGGDAPKGAGIAKYVPKKELWMFGIAALGQGMIYATMSSYISYFYINILQTPLLFVLLLMLLARVWDAVNDPMMGMIVDKFTTKWGKMKPYILFAALPIGVLTFLMYFDPGFGKTGTMVYAAIVYVLWGMVYTVADVPFWGLPNVMTPDPKERGSVISFSRILNGIGSAVPQAIFLVLSLILPLLMNADGAGYEKTMYMIIAIVSSVLGIVLYILAFFGVKERVNIPRKTTKRQKGEPTTLGRIFRCKPLMIVVIMGILSSGRYLMQAAAVHVARYAFYIGPDALASTGTITTIFTVCSAIGMFGSMLFMPYLYKKFNYKQIIIITSIAGFLASLLTTMMGLFNIIYGWTWAFYCCIPFIIIQCIPLGALNVTSYAMIGDSLDYMEWKTGVRDVGLGSACQGFINKLGNALATSFIVIMYMAIALDPSMMYSESAVKVATDLAAGQRIAMFSLVSIIPGVSLLLCAIPVFFYKIVGAEKEKITRELAEQRAEKGIVVE